MIPAAAGLELVHQGPAARPHRLASKEINHNNHINNDNNTHKTNNINNRNTIIITIIIITIITTIQLDCWKLIICPISLLTLHLLRLLESQLPGNPLWAWEFHPLRLTLCLSQTL